MVKNKVVMTINVPKPVREGLFISAGQRCRSVSSLCAEVLQQWLRDNPPLVELPGLRQGYPSER